MKSFKWVAGIGKVSQQQEKEIRSTVGHSLTTVSISIIKRTTDKKCWQDYKEKRTLAH